MFTFSQLLKLNNLDPSNFRLVRHKAREFDIYEVYRANRNLFEAYQSVQKREVFKGARNIMVFASMRGTKAIFLGIYEVMACYKPDNIPFWLHEKVKFPEFPEWAIDHITYDLKETNLLEDFRERLIIEWGKGTLSWVQKKDKEIVAIRQKGEIEPFKSYGEVLFSYLELQEIIKNPDANITWITALSAVNGVYSIVEDKNGKIYVGSAYGAKGLWGRWKAYASSGHGGNKELKKLGHHSFHFSILEILPGTATAKDAINAENRWKEKLFTRRFGLNPN
jgi:GIY-YIG catalytic domain-containing protein